MISKQKIKNLVNQKSNKKISKKAIKKIDEILNAKIIEIIKHASRNSDFSGRRIIKEEDIE